MTRKRDSAERGKLRIGDDWNAITIIALSQSNPLKASWNPSNTAREAILKDHFRPGAVVRDQTATITHSPTVRRDGVEPAWEMLGQERNYI